MKALEFRSKIKNNRIRIPAKIQAKLNEVWDKNVRVIVLLEGLDENDEEKMIFQQAAQDEFLNGYADSDSIYDDC